MNKILNSEATESEIHLISVDFRCYISVLYKDVDLSLASEP